MTTTTDRLFAPAQRRRMSDTGRGIVGHPAQQHNPVSQSMSTVQLARAHDQRAGLLTWMPASHEPHSDWFNNSSVAGLVLVTVSDIQAA